MERDERLSSAATLENLGENLLPRAMSEFLFERQDIENRVLNGLGIPGRIPVLIGEHGTGKSRLANRVALRLQQGVGLSIGLKGLQVIRVDTATLMSEALYNNQIEHKLSLVAKNACSKAVLFLDEMEVFLGAGAWSEQPDGDVLNLLLPLTKRDAGFRLMGATTPRGWSQISRKRPGFARLCIPVAVPAMNTSSTQSLLRAQAVHFSNRHGFKVEPEVLSTVLELAPSLLPGSLLPGGPSDLLERAFCRLRQDFLADDSLRMLDRERLMTGICADMELPRFLADADATIPKDLIHDVLAEEVLGQPHAVNALTDRIHLMQHRLCAPGRPQGVFLLTGPTGTGKTELAKQVAALVHDSREGALHRFDMSEFATSEAAAAFIGARQWHQSSRTSLVDVALTSAFPVILLDEIEKAHPNAFDALLQVFGEGRLTDGNGRTGNFETALFLLTSNVGAAEKHIGFTEPAAFMGGSETSIPRAVSDFFRPEFINRLTAILRFQDLSTDVIRQIARREVRQLQERPGLVRRSLTLDLGISALDHLMQVGYCREFGARPMQRVMEKLVGGALASWLELNPDARDEVLFISFNPQGGVIINRASPAAPVLQPLTAPNRLVA